MNEQISENKQSSDNAGVIAFPPALYAITLGDFWEKGYRVVGST